MEFPVSLTLTSAMSALVIMLAIHYGAMPFVPKDKKQWYRAVITGVVGSILAWTVFIGVEPFLPGPAIVPRIVALAAFALVASLVYRTTWITGAFIGILAGAIWVAVGLILDLLLPF